MGNSPSYGPDDVNFLFLDVDGVLNVSSAFIGNSNNKDDLLVPDEERLSMLELSKSRLKLLKQILDNSKLRPLVIISSTWRYNDVNLNFLKKHLCKKSHFCQ